MEDLDAFTLIKQIMQTIKAATLNTNFIKLVIFKEEIII